MRWLLGINLVDVYAWYLLVALIVGWALRARQVRAVLVLANESRTKWTRTKDFLWRNRDLVRVRTVLMPLSATAALLVLDWVCWRYVWPAADIDVGVLGRQPLALWVLVPLAALVAVLDVRETLKEWRVDNDGIRATLDLAERSLWVDEKLRWWTLGYVRITGRIRNRVGAALEGMVSLVPGRAWQAGVQTGARFALGAALWCTWLLTDAPR